MTISSVELTQEGSELAGEGIAEEFVQRTYTSQYRVITDDPETDPKSIERYFKTTNRLPYYGRIWRWSESAGGKSDPNSICKKLRVSHRPKSMGVFDVEAMFEPIDAEKNKEKPDNDEGDKTDDPLEWREQISISYTQITEPVMRAVFQGFTTGEDGNDPYKGGIAALENRRGKWMIPQNSALVPYDPLPEKEVDLKVIRMSKNIPKFDSNDYDSWIGTVNDGRVNIFRPNLGMFVTIEHLTGRMKGISGTTDFQNGKAFVRREVEIWVNPKGWRGRLADMGHAALATDNADEGFVSPGDLENKPARVEQQTIKDENDFPMTAPVLLNGRGRPLRSSDPNRTIWTNWQYYDERIWAGTVDQW